MLRTMVVTLRKVGEFGVGAVKGSISRPHGGALFVFVFAALSVTVAGLLLRGQAVVQRIAPKGFRWSFDEIFRGSANLSNMIDESILNLTETEDANSPTSMSQNDAILGEQKRRQQILSEECGRLNISKFAPVNYHHMIVNDAHKILFNFIPKVSCTTWKGVWSKLRAKNASGFPTLGRYPAEEKAVRMKTYRKVLFTREPMSRLLSAYMSKFYAAVSHDNPKLQRTWERAYGRAMAQRYRGVNPDVSDGTPLLNITLAEFMRYITDLGPAIWMTEFNDHWLPQHVVTHPCQIRYDFIGRFEDLAVEGPYVLKWLGVDHLVQFPEYHASNAVKRIADFYKEVPLQLLQRVTKYYELDYKLFGYSSQTTIDELVKGIFEVEDD